MIDEDKLILSGAGGGGGGGGSSDGPEVEDDTLRSRATANVVAALCEGPIEGFADSAPRSIFLNDTPLQDNAGRSNFGDNVEYEFRQGDINQSALGGFGDVRIEQSLGAQLRRSAGPISITTTSSELDRVIVRMGVAALYWIQEDGDRRAYNVDFQIDIFDKNGNQIVSARREIDGKSSSPVDFEYEFSLSGEGPWTVRVDRLSLDPDDPAFSGGAVRVNELYYKAIVGIISKGFKYPGTSLIGLKFRSEGFSSIPRVSALLKGLKIKVPNNYNTRDRTYSGIWNGGFKTEYSNNPAWVFYDLITDDRYGCGDFISESDIDKFALYEVGQYCDERVSDGRGGSEPRFVFNGYINNRGEAYEVLNSLAAAFRGMLYYANGTVVPTQDKPGFVVKHFNPSNVIQEENEQGEITAPPFVYEGTGRKARKTIALVSWNDPDDLYKTKIEYVEDRQAIDQYGYRETEVRGFGCTSRGQAQRLGRWILATNLTEKETVSFKATAQGLFLLPGELIEIADPGKTPGIAAGIVVAGSSSTRIILDRAVTLNSGTAYRLQVVFPDKNYGADVTTGAGTHTAINIASSFPSAPQEGTTWLLRPTSAERRKYRVVGLNENEDNTVTVVATEHNEGKYDLVENSTYFTASVSSVARTRVVPVVTPSSIVLTTT